MQTPSRLCPLLLPVVLAGWCCAAQAGDTDAELPAVTVVATGASNLTAASAGDVDQGQIQGSPLLRPAAVLENIPGMIVTQHSGEGKANQYFMRAFNLDHGTDLALDVDDMPVNMPSHAHGQGYADLNFLIPELVADLHYKKGPYYADEGDFATAGTARIDLSNQLPRAVSIGAGEDGYRRVLLMGTGSAAGGSLVGAGEIYHNDGPFAVPDDYHRENGVLRWHLGDDRDFMTVTAMAYAGKWNSTDQVPERAIDAGVIGRFGSLNPTDGGVSDRSSLSFNRVSEDDAGRLQVSAYVIRYRLDLWSTFTYYLKDPLRGDQMLQHDDRGVYGLKAAQTWSGRLLGLVSTSVVGVQLRIDDIRDVSISPTFQRQIEGSLQDAAVIESAGALYAENTLQWREDVRTTVGVRADAVGFDVTDKLRNADGSCNLQSDPLGCVTGRRRAALVSPKLGIVLGPWDGTTLFVDVGDGFHSNDARGVTRSGENPAVSPVTPLTRAVGGELGVAGTIAGRWQARLDLFVLKLRSELVFDGDAGVTAPSGASTRTGLEWGNHVRLMPWLAAEFNAAFTRARFDGNSAPDDLGCAAAAPSHPCSPVPAIIGRYIPNSPTDVVDAGLTAGRESGWFGSLRARHFGGSPLVEDDSARSPAYTTLDAQLGWRSPGRWLVAVDVFNLANVRWNDIEYFYASRLQGEASPQAGYVVHPGVPRTLRARFQLTF